MSDTQSSQGELSHSERIAQIILQLAEQKRSFFVDGIENPMAVRVTLEAELARLRLEKLRLNSAEKARSAKVRQLRGELMKEALAAIGQAHLIDQCNAQAESLIPPLTQK